MHEPSPPPLTTRPPPAGRHASRHPDQPGPAASGPTQPRSGPTQPRSGPTRSAAPEHPGPRHPDRPAPASESPRAPRANRPRHDGNEPRNHGFLSPIEGSFHPYGVNVLEAPEGAIFRPLRSTDDEQQSGDLDPHHR